MGYISYPLKFFCGTYPLYIDNKSCDIGEGIRLEHPHGTHINASYIGENLEVMHNVTIGKSKGGMPIIGNNVYIGCGACVLGNVKVGDNVKIGANCVVVKDVPSNTTIIGCPAKIVKLNGLPVEVYL